MYPHVSENTQLFVVHMDYKRSETKQWLARFGFPTSDNGASIVSMELEIESKPIDVNNVSLGKCLVVDLPPEDSEVSRALIPPTPLEQVLNPGKMFTNTQGTRVNSSWLQSIKFQRMYRVVRVFPYTISYEF